MFLTIKNIPKTSWSSKDPLNLKPRFSTFFFLCFGLTLFGIGEGLLLVSYTGASPGVFCLKEFRIMSIFLLERLLFYKRFCNFFVDIFKSKTRNGNYFKCNYYCSND